MDPTWIPVAFVLGLAARLVGLPPLVGFLVAGFVLNGMGVEGGVVLDRLKDTGVTLLLFTIGLKLRIGSLLRPEVWAGATVHMLLTVLVFSVALFGLGAAGLPMVADLDPPRVVLVAFALSFSSTVFAIKALEASGEGGALFGRTAIGILIVQDVFAVLFLAVAAGNAPSPYALLLFLLIPLRPVLNWVLERAGHGELLILLGAMLGLGLGYSLFESLGVKGDLGALIVGVLLAPYAKSGELYKALIGFKDLFLVAFFLDIGMDKGLDLDPLLIALVLTAILPLKVALYLGVLTRFRMRVQSSLHASLALANFSEFGLIVAAVAVSVGWIPSEWLVVLALATSLTFVLASPLNASSHRIVARFGPSLSTLETARLHPEEEPVDLGGAQVVIVGMGRVGVGAYEEAERRRPGRVIGMDRDPVTVQRNQDAGRRVVLGDPGGENRIRPVGEDDVDTLLIAVDDHAAALRLARRVREIRPDATVAATARFDDEVQALREIGADPVSNMFDDAGAGLAIHTLADAAADG
ncbi:MAG: cation:proton antiporter [Deltaproteobacteria bacterium]|nr:cation:proton antiporter [Deltaproteobacteria bacterium]